MGMAESVEMEEETVPQSQPLPGQVPNSAGGYSFQVDDMQRLRRFLVLGSEGGTYYISEKKLGRENAEAIIRLIDSGRGLEVVQEITQFSLDGRAAKQNPIIFALALCARDDDPDTKRAAYESLNKVCRIPTHLFAFVQYCEALSGAGSGWGRAHRRAIQNWYTGRSPKALAMAVTKYQQREGWSHRDLLRLSHLKPDNPMLGCVLKYVVKGYDACETEYGSAGEVEEVMSFLSAVETAKVSQEDDLTQLIRDHGLVREHIPTVHLNSKQVWSALLENMPMTAMIRNLGKMSNLGLLSSNDPVYNHTNKVCQQLRDESLLKKARIHPFSVLLALKTYSAGRGDKGKLSWLVNEEIVSALNDAFYLSFKFVERTGKRFMLAVDVSGSMCSPVMGSNMVSCRDASAAMAMVTARVENKYTMLGFSHKLVPLGINPSMRLEEATAAISRIPMGGTDCALPMIHAKEKNLKIDVFIVYTDSETWYGKTHPRTALLQYREASGIDAKLIVCGMASNGFTIADPDDPGMLDVVGFDSAAPQIISNFSLGYF